MTRQSQIKKLEKALEFLVEDSFDYFILFVDLCGSTEFKQHCLQQGFPESVWISRQLLFLQRVAEFVRKCEGTVVKTVGDELIAIFAPATAPQLVLDCACNTLKSFESFKPFQKNARIEAKASIDFGETYNGSLTDEVPYDPIGTPVDRCARLNAIAKNNQVTFSQNFLEAMVTTATLEELKAKYKFKTRKRTLKGLGITTIHSIVVE